MPSGDKLSFTEGSIILDLREIMYAIVRTDYMIVCK